MGRLSSEAPLTVIILLAAAAARDVGRGRDSDGGRGCDGSDGVTDQWCNFHNISISAPFAYVIHFVGLILCLSFRKIFLFVC